ncbi:MAG: ferritin-like domain-containing protein [Paludibacter sp.]|nr:ferritin-like domain-containing protein [Paludibacter sp.]
MNNSDETTLHSTQLMKLFELELKDIHWAENAIVKAMPIMIEKATSPELIDALKIHLTQTKNQITRTIDVFESINRQATTKICRAMDGLIAQSEAIMEECVKGPMRDAGIISAAQKVQHYEIATYGTLCQIANTLGLNDTAKLLQITLNEKKAADKKLTQVAVNVIYLKSNNEKD